MATLAVIQFPDVPEAFDITAETGYVAADFANGDVFKNDGATGLYVENSSGGSITVTAVAARRCNHGFLHDAAIVVPNLFEGFVALEFENERFSSDSGIVSLTYSATGLNVAAVRRP